MPLGSGEEIWEAADIIQKKGGKDEEKVQTTPKQMQRERAKG